MKKIYPAFVSLIVAGVLASSLGCSKAEATQSKYLEEDKKEASALLSACRLGHYEHAPELNSFLRFSMDPEDIGATQYEVDGYLDRVKIRELASAMTRIRAGKASSDGATWVARQLQSRFDTLEPTDVGTTWTELRELGAKFD